MELTKTQLLHVKPDPVSLMDIDDCFASEGVTDNGVDLTDDADDELLASLTPKSIIDDRSSH